MPNPFPEPFNPASDDAHRWADAALRRLCWCDVLYDAPGYDGPCFRTCSYCWPSRKQDREDYEEHRVWFGERWPSDHRVERSDYGYCEHGLDGKHQHCISSGWRGRGAA